MFLRVARDIAKPQAFAVMDLLKRSTGMSVNELAAALKMSYMGVKQHCVDLQKKGLLDTWRRRVEIGRPEMLYRLTAKAAGLYPEAGNEMTLEILHAIQQIYGPSAPDKLLFVYFQRKTEQYQKKVKGGSLAERATAFAKLRNNEGHCASVEYDQEHGFRVVEYHSPLKEIATAFPSVKQMESQMFSRVLNTEVQRSEERVSGLTKFTYLLPAIAAPLPAAPVEKKAPVASSGAPLPESAAEPVAAENPVPAPPSPPAPPKKPAAQPLMDTPMLFHAMAS